jgi:DNA invertase Pin-like site-specific DNA recombinase
MERIAQEMAAEPLKAVAYMRTSSATNVGADKDSERRQRAAIENYAKGAGYELVAEYYDAAVSGADPIETRPGLQRCSTASRATACASCWSRTRAASGATWWRRSLASFC